MHPTLKLRIDSATIRMALGASAQPTLGLVAYVADGTALLNDANFEMSTLPWNFRIKRGGPSSGDDYGFAQAIPGSEPASIEATYEASPESFDLLEALIAKGMSGITLTVTVAGIVKTHKENTLQWAAARNGSPILQAMFNAEYLRPEPPVAGVQAARETKLA